MKRSLIKTTASTILIAILLVVQVILPSQAQADAYTTQVLNYSNPNQFTNGSNAYAFKASDVLNPQLITRVIGCTGVVNKVAMISSAFLQKTIGRAVDKLATHAKIAAATTTQAATTGAANGVSKAASAGIKAGAAIAASTPSGIPTSDTGGKLVAFAHLSVDTIKDVAQATKEMAAIQVKNTTITAPTDAIVTAVNKNQNSIDAASFREECINGIAIQLAKNQLTAMTRDTMNWITTGFGGSPFYPRDTDSFMNSLTQYYLQKETDYFEHLDDAHAGDFPWGRDYARSQIGAYQSNQNPLNSLKSDMANYLLNGYTVQNFSTNFNEGGWNAWLGLTQHPQNNPLGFSMQASQNLANTQARAINNTQQELLQNGGIFNQKKCVEWSKADPNNKNAVNGFTTTVTNPTTPGSTCSKWETVSPGSVILSKIDTYINSPELQLSLVKTMNDALNALFSSLLSKFQNQGLSSLGTTSVDFTNAGGGFGSNELFDASGNLIPLGGGENSITGGNGGSDGAFDLTKNLGNTYAEAVSDGSWNASTNSPQLFSSVGVTNHYYTVSTSGSTDISGTGIYWNKGDKAFFDGTSWSKGVPAYIISRRGVLQNQQDYVDTTKDYLNVVSGILPAIGKLDYCIPGPNPNWQDNAMAASSDLSNTDPTDYWATITSDFMNQYGQKIEALYGSASPMQTPTLPSGAANTSYLEMSPSGLSLTSSISAYADTVAQAKTDIQTTATTESADIAKLNAIKDQVNLIIAAAQKRRTTQRQQDGLPAFKQSCLDAEKVTYVVDGAIK